MANLAEYIKKKWTTEDPETIVQEIGQGKRFPTEALALSKDIEYRTKIVQAGGVDRILEFLLQTDTPFQDVLHKAKGGEASSDDSDLQCPSVWLNVVNNFCQDGFLPDSTLARETRYKIAINMGPLFIDMSDWEKRELFESKDTWMKSLPFFVSMLSGFLASSFTKLADFLVRQDSLPSFLVRVLYLELGDPTIVSEIVEYSIERDDRLVKADIIGLSQTCAAHCIKSLWMKRGKPMVEQYADIPIRPEHQLTMQTGIIKLFEVNGRKGWYRGGYGATLSLFIMLYDKCDRFSSEFGVESVSAKMVAICQRHLSKHIHLSRDRFFMEAVMTGIVTLGATMMTPAINQQQAPIDYNVASAIHAGLLYFCLDVCDSNDVRLAKALDGFLSIVTATANLPETKKALQKQGEDIRCRLERVLARAPYLHTGLNILNQILQQCLPPQPDMNTLGCEFCFEKCNKGTTSKCSFCRTVTYCSDDCKRLNWMLHQKDCCMKRKMPLPKTVEEIIAQGKIMFAQHINQLLFQSALKNLSILDTFLVFDMSEATPLFQTLTIGQFKDVYLQNEDSVEEALKVLTKNRASGSVTTVFIGFTEDGMLAKLVTFPPETAPVMPITQGERLEPVKKWESAQQLVVTLSSAGQGSGAIQKLQAHPQLLRASILKTMKP
ncbi:unnamed protein product [Cylindrotheca closterium]|uniref:MYND-type domain-containing protein n=1 Tax=Cylindrotheca closterium TaxID=2856 RepID=A0AAD2G0I1_9STRA|nr:unnamed protein product [Cylindrotheca closterium]